MSMAPAVPPTISRTSSPSPPTPTGGGRGHPGADEEVSTDKTRIMGSPGTHRELGLSVVIPGRGVSPGYPGSHISRMPRLLFVLLPPALEAPKQELIYPPLPLPKEKQHQPQPQGHQSQGEEERDWHRRQRRMKNRPESDESDWCHFCAEKMRKKERDCGTRPSRRENGAEVTSPRKNVGRYEGL